MTSPVLLIKSLRSGSAVTKIFQTLNSIINLKLTLWDIDLKKVSDSGIRANWKWGLDFYRASTNCYITSVFTTSYEIKSVCKRICRYVLELPTTHLSSLPLCRHTAVKKSVRVKIFSTREIGFILFNTCNSNNIIYCHFFFKMRLPIICIVTRYL